MLARIRRTITRKMLRRAWLRFAALAIGCQFLVPTGYMPGSFADGTPFVLCNMLMPQKHSATMQQADSMHAQMPGEMPAAAHTGGMAEHDEHAGADAWEHCPLGALGASAVLAFAIETPVAPAEPDRISTELALPRQHVCTPVARARAPPHGSRSSTA
jgi:hypothetical protein